MMSLISTQSLSPNDCVQRYNIANFELCITFFCLKKFFDGLIVFVQRDLDLRLQLGSTAVVVNLNFKTKLLRNTE